MRTSSSSTRSWSRRYVDLDLVRDAAGGYLSLLGAHVKTQVRRTRREVGPIEVEVAEDRAGALEIFGELARLRARAGQPADRFLEAVHRRLIETRIAHGEIQLVRIRADEVTLGCLYGFAYRGHVLVHQAGFETFAEELAGLPAYDPTGARVPGLIIRGELDQNAPVSDTLELAQAYGSAGGAAPASIVSIPGAMMQPRLEGAPHNDQFWDAVLAFIDP